MKPTECARWSTCRNCISLLYSLVSQCSCCSAPHITQGNVLFWESENKKLMYGRQRSSVCRLSFYLPESYNFETTKWTLIKRGTIEFFGILPSFGIQIKRNISNSGCLQSSSQMMWKHILSGIQWLRSQLTKAQKLRLAVYKVQELRLAASKAQELILAVSNARWLILAVSKARNWN
jgi:hypothetical protein